MTEVRGIKVVLYRFVRNGDAVIESRFAESGGVPKDWGLDDICDWVEGKYGDLIDQGWEFAFKFVG